MFVMPQGKLVTFHSNMWSLIDSRNSPNNFGNVPDAFLERQSFHKYLTLTIFGDVHSKNKNYCTFDVICESERVLE